MNRRRSCLTATNRRWSRGKWLLRWARGGTGTRPQRKLRALECLLAPSCARARLEGQGGGPREPCAAAALGDHELRPAERHSAEDVRACPSRSDPAHLTACALRPGWLGVRVLRIRLEPADARPRRPALARRHLRVGERRGVVRSLQPQQGRSTAGGDRHEAPHHATATDSRALHSPDDGIHPGGLAHIPSRRRSGRRVTVGPAPGPYLDIARSTASCSSGESAIDDRPRSRSLT